MSPTKPTPGPYRVLEVIPVRELGDGNVCGRALEGHDTITSAEDDSRLEILSTTANMDGLWGSGLGGLLSEVPLPATSAGMVKREQALANARLFAAAADLLAACEYALRHGVDPFQGCTVISDAIAKATGEVPHGS